jgi:hypothetical protein
MVPPGATSGKIAVTANGKSTASATDFIVLQPEITFFSPSSGIVGVQVTINGNNFSNVPSENVVKFNTITAVVVEASATTLKVEVPELATTGKITVSTGGHVVASVMDFTVPEPTITGFSPTIGSANIPIIVTGTNFSATVEFNAVKFNGTTAEVAAATPTQLTVKVPAGSTTGKISVKVGPHTATSDSNFEICSEAEIIITNVTVNSVNFGTNQIVSSFTIQNVGASAVDLSKMSFQNYVSIDDVLGGDKAAGGSTLGGGGTITSGQSYTLSNWIASVTDLASYQYLIVTIKVIDGQTVTECSTANNIATKKFQ